MKWFEDVFLADVFSRAGVNNGVWLSRKQTQICIMHMREHQSFPASIDGQYRHIYYTCHYDGRDVRLDYSKANGCGCIKLGYSNAELRAAKKRSMDEEQRQYDELIRFLAEKRPDRLDKKISGLFDRIQEWEEEIQYCIEDHQSEEMISRCRKERDSYAAELNRIKMVLVQL